VSKDPRFKTTEVSEPEGPERDEPARAQLRVVYPAELAAALPLERARILLGRQPDDEHAAPLLHGTVSRKHFAIEWDGRLKRHTGVDLGSRNGSNVDGQPAAAPTPLGSGSVVRVGNVLLVYESGPGVGAGDADAEAGPGAGARAVSRDAIPGDAAATRLLRAAVARTAPDPSPVLLIGETGTGKEFVADELHRLSGRDGKLVAINCAALSPQLVESQLFGHVRGAFTGATEDQPGLFRAAQGGTLLLDEIGELPLDLQPKLLRAIQEKEVRPVGGTRSVRVDVRILAATNRDLSAQVESGCFRRDLYARLSLWEIRVPPLRERRADLLGWIDRLHRKWLAERARADDAPLAFDAKAAEALLLCDWPDNLRGVDRLVHMLAAERPGRAAVSLSQLPGWLWGGAGAAEPAAAPGKAATAPASAQATRPPVPTREELEAALAQHNGSVRAVARHFGRDRRQIYRWLEAHGLKGK